MATFNFTFDPGTTVQQMVGFELAGRIWGAYLTDNVTINIQAGVSSNLPTGVIGGALPGMRASESYTDFSTKLQSDQTSWSDKTAVKNLDNDFWFGIGSMTLLPIDLGVETTANTLNLTTANAKALGISVPNTAGLDGYILFSNLSGTGVSWNYDYTRSSAMSSSSLDFLSTAMHEIGHILGFVSGVDTPGWLDASNILTNLSGIVNNLLGRSQNISPLDFFRYSFDSEAKHNASRDVIIGNSSSMYNKYFSIDGGKHQIAQFASGADKSLQGDGNQASHWKAGTNGIMAPTLRTGQRQAMGSVDLQALDVIGWDLTSTGISTTIDLSALSTQAKASLATRIGQTSAWLDANAVTAATQLSQDRSVDIAAMLKDSQIYNWGSDDDPGPYWQKITTTFAKRSAFETLEELEIVASTDELPQLDLTALLPGYSGVNPAASPLSTTASITIGSSPIGSSKHAWQGLSDRLNQASLLTVDFQASMIKTSPIYEVARPLSPLSVKPGADLNQTFIAQLETRSPFTQLVEELGSKHIPTPCWGSDDGDDWFPW